VNYSFGLVNGTQFGFWGNQPRFVPGNLLAGDEYGKNKYPIPQSPRLLYRKWLKVMGVLAFSSFNSCIFVGVLAFPRFSSFFLWLS
jgi:hypothetical protein